MLARNLYRASDETSGILDDAGTESIHTPFCIDETIIFGRDMTILNPRHQLHLQMAWSQMSEMPRHSSKGGAGGHPGGRAELYAALNAS